ncbi:MAG TPA: type II toxin-antitoxin system antitoxin SocA domain-containing protein [Dyadobacter sp.]|nr:type II toxin-antitoxin system antitoxin SocA domain-containing protein [Dyadobacter sp.]
MIYLIEEYAVRTYGLSFFNLDFSVWKLGPVSRDLFVDLSSDEPVLLANYINRTIADSSVFITPKKAFSDDEFRTTKWICWKRRFRRLLATD